MDNFCSITKTIPYRTSVHTQKWLGRRDFCYEAKLRRSDPLSGESLIRQVFTLYRMDFRSATKSYLVYYEHRIIFMLSPFTYFCLLLWVVESAVRRKTNKTVHNGKIIFVILSYNQKKNAKKLSLKNFFKTLKTYNDVSNLRFF